MIVALRLAFRYGDSVCRAHTGGQHGGWLIAGGAPRQNNGRHRVGRPGELYENRARGQVALMVRAYKVWAERNVAEREPAFAVRYRKGRGGTQRGHNRSCERLAAVILHSPMQFRLGRRRHLRRGLRLRPALRGGRRCGCRHTEHHGQRKGGEVADHGRWASSSRVQASTVMFSL